MQALNLGISAIGFAVVAKKLNRIHQEMDRLIAKVDLISRKQDLAMVAKMEGALETADRAIRASSNDIRRNGLMAAMHELPEVSKFMKRCLEDLISSKAYLSKLLDENDLALRDVENAVEENKVILADHQFNSPEFQMLIIAYRLLRNIGPEKVAVESFLSKPSRKTGELILDTHQQLKSYQLEIDYVRRNGITYREWMALGDSEAPRLSFLLPKKF